MSKEKILLYAFLGLMLTLSACQHHDTTDEENTYEGKEWALSDQISNKKVKSICEDQYGQIWIGTFRGLNKYDSNKYYQYFCVHDSVGLPDNNISSVFRDSKNRLWITTANGICYYNEQGKFTRIPLTMQNKNFTQILEDKAGRMFFTTGYTFYQYDEKTNKLVVKLKQLEERPTFNLTCHIDDRDIIWIRTPQIITGYRSDTFQKVAEIKLSGHSQYSYLQDGHKLWLSGYDGMQIFDTRTRQLQALPASLKSWSLPHDMVNIVHPYGKNGILLNTTKHGLWLLDNHHKLVHQSDKNFPFDLGNMQVSQIFTDSKGNLWLGSEEDGVKTIYRYQDMFNSNLALQRSVGKQAVLAIVPDHTNHLWIATKKDGIYVYDLENKQIKKIPKVYQNSNDDKKNIITNLYVDARNYIWLADAENVAKCKYENGELRVVDSYPIFMPMEFAQDKQGNMWVSTAGVDIYLISHQDGTMTKKQLFPSTFTFIPSIICLNNGNLLVSAFYKPILEIDGKTKVIREFKVNPTDWKKCIKRSVYIPTKTLQDSKGNIWFGTVTNGLLKYDANTHRMQPIPGLSCSDISSIEEDKNGNLWVSTMYGLNKLDIKAHKITSYKEADGIGGFQFYDRASCKLKDGTLIFGGTHGLTIFNPQNVTTNQPINLLFENLKVHNNLVQAKEKGNIEESMEHSPHIHLGYKENSFSISFSAIDYSDYKRIHYFYQLEGFDKSWVDAGSNTEAYYSNLPAGCYTFKVKIVGNDNNHTIAEKSIKVSIAPEPWNAWWAWCLYILLATGAGYAYIRFKQRINMEKEMARKAEVEKEQEQRINKMNMSFFANISHEFRTPLTMISGPVEQLCESTDINKHNKQLLNIINRSVNRMLKLVNQLLDFNKLENDTLRLHVKLCDIVTEMQRIIDLFIVNAEEKGITLNCHGLEGSYLIWLDVDKLEKIINNLMSNAMKFTPRGGKIDVTLDSEIDKKGMQWVKITVADTGKGIPEKELDNIFKRYYQLNNQSASTINWGTGIGLYYARSLALLHHGKLFANNRKDCQGAVFTLALPTHEEIYSDAEKRNLEEEQKMELSAKKDSMIANKIEQEDGSDNRPKVLIVDDDTEVVHYLRTLLATDYHVIYRFDAESALKAAREEEPSLILSDVVMPGLSGYELCKAIKQDIQLCHIPVILVTAKTTPENQVEGLNSGADAYVTKPFTPKVLLAMINSLLTNREKAKTILNNATQTDKSVEEVLSPQDKAFMDELYKIMEQELANSELDVNKATELMHISRTKLYYKVKGLTGENPSVFFKTYKLNRAAALIVEGKYNISEIAYMTGFNTLSHFSTSFKKQFGCSPSEYSKKKY